MLWTYPIIRSKVCICQCKGTRYVPAIRGIILDIFLCWKDNDQETDHQFVRMHTHLIIQTKTGMLLYSIEKINDKRVTFTSIEVLSQGTLLHTNVMANPCDILATICFPTYTWGIQVVIKWSYHTQSHHTGPKVGRRSRFQPLSEFHPQRHRFHVSGCGSERDCIKSSFPEKIWYSRKNRTPWWPPFGSLYSVHFSFLF